MTHANQGKRLQNMILSVDAALKDCLQGSQGCPSIGTADSCVDFMTSPTRAPATPGQPLREFRRESKQSPPHFD